MQILSRLLNADALDGQLAQLVDQWADNPRVSVSIPELGIVNTKACRTNLQAFVFVMKLFNERRVIHRFTGRKKEVPFDGASF